MMRKLLSIGLFSLMAFFLYSTLGFTVGSMAVLGLAALGFLWEPAGYVSLALLGVLLVYRSPEPLLALMTLVLAIEYVESVHLAKRKAPAIHYYVLFAGTLMAVPIYYFAYLLSLHVPSFVNTIVAALFVVLLYVLFYIVVKR